ncbi:MAG: ABC transporter permease [Bacteroidota bacterium]
MKKNRLVSFINVIGLALGLTVGIFILLYVQNETSYDKWIPDHENIYRVYRPYANGTKGNLITPSPVARAMREEIPGVVSATKFKGIADVLLEWKKQHYTVGSAFVDTTFFKTIPFQLNHGDVRETYHKIDVAVLSYQTAQRIFGNINPVGESIIIDNTRNIKIVGVLESQKGESHLDVGMYIIEKGEEGYWTGGDGRTYARLSPKTKIENVENALFEIAKENVIREYEEDGDDISNVNFSKWALQPIADIHLKSQHLGETGANRGNIWQITMLSLIGLLILVLAGINYINLTTAQISTRAKEIGVRNVAGATRQNLIAQFLSEALVTTTMALGVAVILAGLFLPFFNEIVSRSISFMTLLSGWTPVLILGLTLFTGLTTGVFPAFYFSKIRPAETLKQHFFSDKKTGLYRNTLIVSQFALSIGLVLFVTLVWQQVDYMMKKDLGFNEEQIAVFRINEEKNVETFQSKKEQFKQIAGVAGVSQISRHPGGFISNYTMNIEGIAQKSANVNILFGDTDWNKTFQIEMKSGRFFSNENPTDTASAFVVNETFVQKFGIENPIGHRIKFSFDETYSTIIGVVEDFHYKGLQSSIAPVAICARPNEAWMGGVAVRFESGDINNALTSVSNAWKNMEPVFPVTYTFLDEAFTEQYQSYLHFGRSLTYATFLCMFLALIGLFGLTVFVIQRKTKEIGIRKVLGASVVNIISMLSKDFLKLVLIAFFIATPVAYYFLSGWLENFAYQMEIQWWVFLMVGAFAVGVAFLTVGFHSIRAATTNPVNSIRSE